MLYGRRLDQALEHVDGSRYALVHAVAKRARQITLWLTADPAELRAEAAPPPAPGELATRDPVALSEAEILQGEVVVRWDPDGLAEEPDVLESTIETDPLLLDGIGDDDDLELGDDIDVTARVVTESTDDDVEDEVVEDVPLDPALVEGDDDADDDDDLGLDDDEEGGASLEALQEEELDEPEDEED